MGKFPSGRNDFLFSPNWSHYGMKTFGGGQFRPRPIEF